MEWRARKKRNQYQWKKYAEADKNISAAQAKRKALAGRQGKTIYVKWRTKCVSSWNIIGKCKS